MPVPCSAPITLQQVFEEIYGRSPNVGETYNLDQLVQDSSLTDKVFPHDLLMFLCYSHTPYVFTPDDFIYALQYNPSYVGADPAKGYERTLRKINNNFSTVEVNNGTKSDFKTLTGHLAKVGNNIWFMSHNCLVHVSTDKGKTWTSNWSFMPFGDNGGYYPAGVNSYYIPHEHNELSTLPANSYYRYLNNGELYYHNGNFTSKIYTTPELNANSTWRQAGGINANNPANRLFLTGQDANNKGYIEYTTGLPTAATPTFIRYTAFEVNSKYNGILFFNDLAGIAYGKCSNNRDYSLQFTINGGNSWSTYSVPDATTNTEWLDSQVQTDPYGTRMILLGQDNSTGQAIVKEYVLNSSTSIGVGAGITPSGMLWPKKIRFINQLNWFILAGQTNSTSTLWQSTNRGMSWTQVDHGTGIHGNIWDIICLNDDPIILTPSIIFVSETSTTTTLKFRFSLTRRGYPFSYDSSSTSFTYKVDPGSGTFGSNQNNAVNYGTTFVDSTDIIYNKGASDLVIRLQLVSAINAEPDLGIKTYTITQSATQLDGDWLFALGEHLNLPQYTFSNPRRTTRRISGNVSTVVVDSGGVQHQSQFYRDMGTDRPGAYFITAPNKLYFVDHNTFIFSSTNTGASWVLENDGGVLGERSSYGILVPHSIDQNSSAAPGCMYIFDRRGEVRYKPSGQNPVVVYTCDMGESSGRDPVITMLPNSTKMYIAGKNTSDGRPFIESRTSLPTTSGGTWTRYVVSTDSTQSITGMFFVNNNEGLFFGNKIYGYSLNGGTTWIHTNESDREYFAGDYVQDASISGHWVVIGGHNINTGAGVLRILSFNNGGGIIHKTTGTLPSNLECIRRVRLLSATEWYILGSTTVHNTQWKVWKSGDKGTSWQPQILFTTEYVHDMIRPSNIPVPTVPVITPSFVYTSQDDFWYYVNYRFEATLNGQPYVVPAGQSITVNVDLKSHSGTFSSVGAYTIQAGNSFVQSAGSLTKIKNSYTAELKITSTSANAIPSATIGTTVVPITPWTVKTTIIQTGQTNTTVSVKFRYTVYKNNTITSTGPGGSIDIYTRYHLGDNVWVSKTHYLLNASFIESSVFTVERNASTSKTVEAEITDTFKAIPDTTRQQLVVTKRTSALADYWSNGYFSSGDACEYGASSNPVYTQSGNIDMGEYIYWNADGTQLLASGYYNSSGTWYQVDSSSRVAAAGPCGMGGGGFGYA
jgi:hypothetical protein